MQELSNAILDRLKAEGAVSWTSLRIMLENMAKEEIARLIQQGIVRVERNGGRDKMLIYCPPRRENFFRQCEVCGREHYEGESCLSVLGK